uniref:PEP-CTERM protein-sorting domain-containing protein n=1 Tax=Solibacter usitatus (strain Ellin6076) TaxID=234267 RepID=Q01XI2_SOLUE
MKTQAFSLFAILAFGTIANAAPAPLPSTFTSSVTNVAITVQDAVGPGSPAYGSAYRVSNGGGAFYGTLGLSPTATTAFWCIDSQTTFSPGESGQANVTLLSDTAGLASSTWYGTAGSPSGWHWTNGAVDGLTATDSVQTRLEMAAYLIQQYGYTSFGYITGTSKNSSYSNADVQQAIWAIMNNSHFTSPIHDDPNSTFTLTGGSSGVDYWVKQASAAIAAGHITPTKFAVVTWDVPMSGGNAEQTFLVQITPEPGFYGALALGLSGLCLAIGRKRKAA